MVDQRKKRRFKNYLLNARLQLRYVAWVVVIAALVAMGLGGVIYAQSTFASAQLSAALATPDLEWLDPVLRQQILERLTLTDTSLAMWMLGVGLLLGFALFAALVVLTHKVAGPLYRMAMLFEQLRTGHFTPIGSLRRGDQLADVFEALRAALDALAARRAEEARVVAALAEACNAPDVPPTVELLRALEELQALLTPSSQG